MSMVLDTKFADMPVGVRNRWLGWAKSHHWGGDTEPRFVERTNGLVMEASMGYFHSDQIDTVYHSTPRELRDWAGY